MGLFKDYVNMTRKPEGFLGSMMIKGMNSGHAKMADWGISHLKGSLPSDILEIGCGGGRNANVLMKKYPLAKMTAVDYSPLSVEKTKEYNAQEISAGRCTVQQEDVSSLSFAENTFDLATAFETIYFWPGLEHCFSQVYHVLKNGGRFMIVNEANGLDKTGEKWEKMIEGMHNYTKEQISDAMQKAGFSDIETYDHPDKPWIIVIGKKKK